MEILTAEQIAERVEKMQYTPLGSIREINWFYRQQDESHLWPISGKFNATERAIRQARAFRGQSDAVYGLEYCYLLDSLLSAIVNDPKSG